MSSRGKVDPSLYVVLDPNLCGGRPLEKVALAAAMGGATLFQLRDKDGSTRNLVESAERIQKALAPRGVPLLINDRVDVALASGAEGVHIGQEDLSPSDARRLLGEEAIIGLTIRSMREAVAAPLDLLDYASIGGVFPTQSKDNPAGPIGVEGLREIAAYFAATGDLPLCAISGITLDNIASVIEAGVQGVALISAVCAAPDPAAAARELRQRVETAKEKLS